LLPDLPSYGQSTGFSIESYALTQEVFLIRQFVQKLGLKEPHITGNSMGSTIAALYSEQYPDDIKSLGFIGAPLGIVGWSPQVKSAILKGINPFVPVTVSQFDLELSLLFYKPPTISAEVKQSAVNGYVSNNMHYQQIWNIVNLDLMVLDQKKKSTKPTFIAWGMHDGVFNISGKRLLDERFPNGLSLTISDAAHLIMLEKPKEIADQYLNFLNSLPAN
jgi:pimeloyl-ACP methyl ester carboxylesterase